MDVTVIHPKRWVNSLGCRRVPQAVYLKQIEQGIYVRMETGMELVKSFSLARILVLLKNNDVKYAHMYSRDINPDPCQK